MIRKTLFIISISTFLCIVSSTYSFADFGWKFDNQSENAGWRIINGIKMEVNNGSLVIDWARKSQLVSPPGLNIRNVKYMVMRARFSKDSLARLRILSSTNDKVLFDKVWLKGDDKFHNYIFNTALALKDNGNIDAFSFEFIQGPGRAEIDSIKFVDPRGLELVGFVWKDFWKPIIQDASLIVFIPFPRIGAYSLILPSYILIFVITAVIMLFMARKRGGLKTKSVIVGITISFLIVGSIFTLRMDYKWLLLWQRDQKLLSSIDIERRSSILYMQDLDEFITFIDFVKDTVPANESVYPAYPIDDGITNFARYRMLPVKYSVNARYLWSFNDMDIKYDSENHLLIRNGVEVKPVELVKSYKGFGDVYRVLERLPD